MERHEIEERILECCNAWPEVTTSDLQGMVGALAAEITRSTQPRAPTRTELEALAVPVARFNQIDCEDALAELECAKVAVFDNYCSDGPGYCGRVALVLWGGGPECTQTFVLDRNVPGEVPVQLVEA